MISYHLTDSHAPAYLFKSGFQVANVKDLDRIAACMKIHAWSPCVWKDGMRNQKNFEQALFCVLDFDDGEYSLDQVVKEFCDTRSIIGTTKNHQKEKNGITCDRFRLLIEWEKPIKDLRTYRYAMHEIMAAHPCDKSCKDGARFFYPCTEIISVNKDKDCFYQPIPKSVPEDFEKYPEPGELYTQGKIIPKSFVLKFERNYKPGSRNTALYGFSKDCAKLGLGEQEIIAAIKGSIIYHDVSPLEDIEFMTTVRNGIKA